MATPYIRREVRSLGPGDQTLEAYAEAVRVMKERDDGDPTSWAYQAAIHGTHAPPTSPLWDQCKHGSWFFLPWHRMFVYYFERIVRAAVQSAGGPEDWALPYWNYGLNGVNASLPDGFRDPEANGRPNPLYVEARATGINGGAVIPEKITEDAVALGRPDFVGVAEFGGGVASAGQQFWGKTGRVEQTPHNVIHVAVGGPGGWMSDPDRAAQDPIFWLHHANIDRIWAVWNGRGGVDPSETEWGEQSFGFFDENGDETAKTCAEVLDTIADLDYTYDPPPTGAEEEYEVEPSEPEKKPEEVEEPKVVGAAAGAVELTGETATVPLEVDERAREEVTEASRESDPRRLYLNIEDIEGEDEPGTVYGVYVNLPDEPSEKQLEEHLVTNISFFGIKRAGSPRSDEHAHGLRVSVDVAHFLGALGEGDTWDGKPIQVTFRPYSLIPGEGQSYEYLREQQPAELPPVRVGRVSLSVE